MNINTALKKLETLSIKDLLLARDKARNDIQQYKDAIENYSESKMEKYGIPFLGKLQAVKAKIDNEIAFRNAGG